MTSADHVHAAYSHLVNKDVSFLKYHIFSFIILDVDRSNRFSLDLFIFLSLLCTVRLSKGSAVY